MKIIRAVLRISSITMLSRILGYVRDAVMAATIGTGVVNDAFIAAFKLTNLFRTIFGEGAMSSAFTPMFSKLYISHGDKYAKTVAMHVQSLLILALLCFVGLIFSVMPWLIKITTPGFAKSPHAIDLAVELAYITFPYLFFISIAAFYGSILNAKDKFMPYAATSVLLNIVVILGISVFTISTVVDGGEYNVHVLAYSTLVAGIIELLWMIIFAKKNNLLLPFRRPYWYKYTKLLMKRLLPALAGSGVAQINIWIDMIIVSFVPGGMSYLYFADRIIQLPLALIGTALGTVMLATVARSKDVAQTNLLFSKSVIFSGFLVLPAAFGIYATAFDTVDVLFARGRFDLVAVQNTAAALALWTWALPAFVMMKVLTSILYARGDTKTPVKVAVLAVLVNAAVGLGLLKYYSYLSVVIASIASSWLSVAILLIVLHRNYSIGCNYAVMASLAKSIFASCIMLIFICQSRILLYETMNVALPKVLIFCILVLTAAGIYFGTSFLLGSFKDLRKMRIDMSS